MVVFWSKIQNSASIFFYKEINFLTKCWHDTHLFRLARMTTFILFSELHVCEWMWSNTAFENSMCLHPPG